ncbi:MAG TPA: M13 family metallopeptidase [Steroidobacteraceae bacterium]|nr:M13 family metallopeptidase [Steroidobacteraceae bacterium]
MPKSVAVVVTALLAVTACSTTQTPEHAMDALASTRPVPTGAPSVPAAPPARIGKWGIDLTSRDASVKPGDDFYRYAIGHWLDTNEIPPDRTSWSTFAMLANEAEQQLRELIEALPADAPPGSNAQKVRDMYRTYLDTNTIEKLGLEPVKPLLASIASARTHEDVAKLLGRPDVPLRTPLRQVVTIDAKNPDRYIVAISQGGLGLPDREYYLKDDTAFAEIRSKYVAHIERMLTLAGEKNAAAQAKSIMALETAIAKLHWPIAKRRERDLTYNLRTREQLNELAPEFPWHAQLAAGGIDGQHEYVVRELDAVEGIAKLFRKTPVAQWRSYMTYHLLERSADTLPKAFDDERFDFYGRTLNGQPQQRERWTRAIDALDEGLGEATGQLYVAKYFPPESKAKMLALVENLRAAYAERVKHLPWMTEATKKAALEKLATFRPKIGYPDKWRDYSALEIRSGDAFGNAVRAAAFDWQRDVNRLNQPTDRDEWGMTPQTVNAYYNPTFNEIVFPAAILQPPYFDPNADAAVNYGAIGGVIGHEMGHGFDDQGAKSDARGVLRTWWAPEDTEAFKNLVDRLATQYDGYTALPGLNLNGRLTLGENIGDLGGLTVAYEAYHISLQGKPAPVLDGLTGDQRFFLSWAQAWRNLIRDARLRTQVMSDPHSPPKFRVNGVVRNMDAWYTAFDVQPGDKLYLPPDERVRIW